MNEIVTRGNDFYIKVNLFKKLQSGVTEPFDLTVCDSVNGYIYQEYNPTNKICKDIGIVSGATNSLYIDVTGIPTGKRYIIEVVGKLNGRNFRCAEIGFLDICEYNSSANITWETIEGTTGNELDMTFEIVSNAAVIGKNAYELAVESGYTGTLQDYLDEMTDAGQSAAEARQAAEETRLATTNANNAANNANNKATLAQFSANNANNAASAANTAANNAHRATTAATRAAERAEEAATVAERATESAERIIERCEDVTTAAERATAETQAATTNARNATTATRNATTAAQVATENAVNATTQATTATNNAISATTACNDAKDAANAAATNANQKATLANNAATAANNAATAASATNESITAAEVQREIAEQHREEIMNGYDDRLTAVEDDKADITGYYETMGVGTATNLLGSTASYAAFSNRTAGGSDDIASGVAVLSSIRGNTIHYYNVVNSKQSNQSATEANYWSRGNTTSTVEWDFNKQLLTYTIGSNTQHSTYFVRNKVKQYTYYSGRSGYGNAGNNMPIWYLEYSVKVTPGANTDQIAVRHIRPEFMNQYSEGLDKTIEPNKVYHFKHVWKQKYSANSSLQNNFQFNFKNGNAGSAIYVGDKWEIWNIQLVNLTNLYKNPQLNANAITADEFYNLFPNVQASYNTSVNWNVNLSTLNVKTAGIKTVGFNQYDYETGTAYLLGGNEYQITGTYSSITKDNETIVVDEDGKFTPSLNGTLTVVGGGADTCVHLVWSGYRNGDFEDYWSNQLDIDVTAVTDTTTDEPVFPDGMNGIVNVFDEMTPTQAIKRVGIINLQSLANFTNYDEPAEGETTAFIWSADLPADAKVGGEVWVQNLTYYHGNFNPDSPTTLRNIVTNNANGKIWIYLMSKSTLTASSYNNLELYYELANPEVHSVNLGTLNYRVDDFGTEIMLPTSALNAMPTSAPLKCEIKYNINASDTLRRLPTNYISLESAKNMLEKVGEELDGIFTLTWDSENEHYITEFIPNAADLTEGAESGYLNNQGEVVSSTAWKVSDFLEIKPRDNIIINCGAYSTAVRHAFYDSEQNFISVTDLGMILNITVPSTASYIRVSYNVNADNVYIKSNYYNKILAKK